MKLYIVGNSEEEIAKIKKICSENGWDFKLTSRISRPSVNQDVKKVLNAYSQVGKRGAAQLLGINPGAVWRILKRDGALESAVGERHSKS